MSNNTYTSLSNYLENRLENNFYDTNNDIINEKFDLSSLGKSLKGILPWNKMTDDKKEKATGLMGWIGSFWANFSSAGNAEDPLMKKYAEIAKAEAENEEKRLRDEYNEQQAIEIEKLEAEYQHNKRQLDIANTNKINAYKATQRKIKEYGKRAASRKVLLTAEENEKIINNIRNAGKDLGLADDNPLMELQELATVIAFNEDGTPRSQEDIAAAAKDENSSIYSYIQRYNEIGKPYRKGISEAMNSTVFKEQFGKLQNEVVDDSQVESQLTTAENTNNDFKETSDAIAKVKSIQKAYNDANDAVDTKQKDLEAIIGTKENKNPFITSYDSEKGEAEPLNTTSLKDVISKFSNDKKYLSEQTNADGSTSSVIDINKLRDDLKEKGIPEDVLDDIVASPSDDETESFTMDKLNKNLDNLTDDKREKVAKGLAEKVTAKAKTAQAALKTAKETRDSKINLADPNLSEDEIKSKINSSFSEPERTAALKAVKKVKSIGNGSLDLEKNSGTAEYDIDTPAGKDNKAKLEKSVKEAQEAVNKNKGNKEGNKKALAAAQGALKARQETQIPSDLKDLVSKKLDGVEPGEFIDTDGNLGVYTDEGFIKKPGADATDKEETEYVRKRALANLKTDPSMFDSGIKSIKKNPDGDGYLIDYGDGEKVVTDKDKIAEAYASKKSSALAKEGIAGKKQAFADKIQKCIKDGKIDTNEFKALNDSTDPESQAMVEAIKDIAKNGDVGDYFKGVDLQGDITAEKIKDVLGNNSKEISKRLEEWDDEDYTTAKKEQTDNDWTEYDDEDEENADKDDENEYDTDEDEEIDDEENAKNKDGEKLVKVDGKWYKESDVTDGTPNEGAEEQTNVAKKTQKKKIQNPAKKYHRRKNKRTGRTTKNYYDNDGNSVNPQQYKDMVKRYAEAKKKASEPDNNSLKYNNLTNYLLEKLK